MLSEAELDTLVPTLLLSNDTVLVDQPVRPGHTEQLLALLSEDARAEATT